MAGFCRSLLFVYYRMYEHYYFSLTLGSAPNLLSKRLLQTKLVRERWRRVFHSRRNAASLEGSYIHGYNKTFG